MFDNRQKMVYCQHVDLQKIKAQYDNLYAANPEIFGSSSLDFLKKVFSKVNIIGNFALDIGGGTGNTSEFLASRNFSVDLVDLSEETGKMTFSDNIFLHKIPIQDFKIAHEYTFVYCALTAHHVDEVVFMKLVNKLKKHSTNPVIHAYRLFTTNSDFFKKNSTTFFDNNSNLDELYSDWKILLDSKHNSKASTSDSVNQVREVVYYLGDLG